MKSEIIDLPKILDKRGSLSFFEYPNQIPFEIARTYWIYDVPGGEVSGSNAFKNQQEFIVARSGSFDVILHDGVNGVRFSLNRSYHGLYILKMYWRRLENFSTNSLALIVSDQQYCDVTFTNDLIPRSKMYPQSLVKKGVSIGANSTIVAGLYQRRRRGSICIPGS